MVEEGDPADRERRAEGVALLGREQDERSARAVAGEVDAAGIHVWTA
jgi:hypothetical protein